MTKKEYEAYLATLSEERCGISFNIPRTIRECNPPSQDNRTCGVCGAKLHRVQRRE